MDNTTSAPLRCGVHSTDSLRTDEAAGMRLRRSAGLVAAIWAVGLIGHFTPLGEWPALFLYVLGSIGLTLYHCVRRHDWVGAFVTRRNLRTALIWGGGIGLLLAVVGTVNTLIFYASGGRPMTDMQILLVDLGLMYLFPALALAEEWLWRGMALSSLLDRGINRHAAVIVTTLAYMVNHFFVAPVGWVERGMMAMMGLPIGLMAGYLALKTRNVWSAVALHTIIMAAMMLIVFVIPAPSAP